MTAQRLTVSGWASGQRLWRGITMCRQTESVIGIEKTESYLIKNWQKRQWLRGVGSEKRK
jgi:hypothetical protein